MSSTSETLSYSYNFTIKPVQNLKILPENKIIERFKIHPDTGELTVQDNLDREEQATYNLIVQAYDNYQFGK